MKKALVLALSLSLAGFAAQAQTAAVKPANAQEKVNGPQITFMETRYDFGKIHQNDIVEHVFKFKNTGTAPLVISNIGVSCGCTTPDWTREPIAPGKTGTITAKFNSANKMGVQNKVLTVESNSVGGNTTVSLDGEVLDANAVIPAAEVAKDVPAEKAKSKDAGVKVKTKAKKS